jgi:hypothetical protein
MDNFLPPNINLGYKDDSWAGERRFNPQAYIRPGSSDGFYSVADFVEFVSHVQVNPYVKANMLRTFDAVGQLFAPNPQYAKLLAPGAPKIAVFQSMDVGETTVETPTRNPRMRFGINKMTRNSWQIAATRFTLGGQYPHIENMAIGPALRASGIYDIKSLILEHNARTMAVEASRMAFAQLMAMVYDNWHNHPTRDLIYDISSDTDATKYMIILFGESMISYDSMPSPPEDNEGLPSIQVITEGASGYGAGSSMIIERHKGYCAPNYHTWVGGRQSDMFVTRPELLDFTYNWKRRNDVDRRDMLFGVIVCNAEPSTANSNVPGGVTRDNCLSATAVLDAAQQFWGDRKNEVTNILLPSRIENFLLKTDALLAYPAVTGFSTNVSSFANRMVRVTDSIPLFLPDIGIEDQFPHYFPTNKADLRAAVANGIMDVPGVEIPVNFAGMTP